MEEGGRGINGRLMKSAIFMVWEARGVKRPGIHVVRFYQPICKAKALLEKMTQVQRFSSFNERPIGKEIITKVAAFHIAVISKLKYTGCDRCSRS